jgi:amino acid adenylation domain-containing protein/non-ribosomal peptide synthase protein (TIGR01720 family)/FkbM family methyltransferase
VVDERQQLTYAELDAQSSHLAHVLQQAGVGPEVLVALSLERSLPMLVAMLAVLKAGGVYVPLDQAWPREQTQAVLRDLRIRYMLIAPDAVPDPTLADVTILPLSLSSEEDAPVVRCNVTPANLAYVLFTSGSTGKPKAVAIEHRQICHYIRNVQERLKLLPEQTYATVSPFTADLGYTMLFTSLCVGGTLHIISPARAVDPEALADYFGHYGPDYLKIGPPHLAALLSGTRPEILLPRQKLIMGGETLHWNFVERLHALSPTCEIVNHYGPAETTVGALTFDVTEHPTLAATCPVGSPLPGTQVYILDSYLQPVPTMVPGEIYIGGEGVGRGYLFAPELTAERFLPHPFSTQPGDRLYRTGDRGRYLPDGRVEFLGRVDHQVKIRGFRVEPDGIEPHLLQHPAVKEALVLAEDEGGKRQQLTAYVVPRETATAVYKGRERYVLPNNLAVLQLNSYETDFFYKQIFLYRTEFRNNISLPEHAVVFDVGANIGLFTLFVQLGYRDAQIYAFEPIPAIFEVLQLNAELYAPAARVFPLGVADSTREATFTYYPYSSCQSGYYADAAEDKQTLKAIMLKDEREEITAYVDAIVEERSEARPVVCQLRTLSELLKEHALDHIDLLKIDVEKSELDILRGIQDEDWPKIAQIVIEAHDIHGRIAVIQDMLEKRGYSVQVEQNHFIQDTTLYNVYARRSQVVSTSSADIPAQFPEPYLTPASLAALLTERLPEYMLPASYVLLPTFPLLPNGKRDRAALRQMGKARHAGEKALTPPRTAVEAQLVEIWQDVLKQTEIGIQHNFFALGGDSILAILVVGQASKAGLHLIARQLFEHPTIAELASVVTSEPVIQAEQGPVTGAVGLTPIQRWFFAMVQTDRHHWNQAVLLTIAQRLDPAVLERAFQAVLLHHDILRARFFLEQGEWQQVVDESVQGPLLQVVDLTAFQTEAQRAQMEERCAELQATLSLEEGRLVQAMLFDLGSEQRLFLVIHHLLVDGVSWQIILGDLYTAYEQTLQGQALQLPLKTTSFQAWSASLAEYAHSSALQDELPVWLTRLPEHGISLLEEYVPDLNTVASEQAVTFTLPAEETLFLLYQVPDLLSVQVQEVLLAALALTFASQGRDGYLLVDLEGHGREQIQEGIDLSRTVGWFTTFFPLALDMQRARTSAEALVFVKEQLRSLPYHGIGYGLLRYLRPDLSAALTARSQAQVRLNYLGQIARAGSASAVFELVEGQMGSAYSHAGQRSYVLDIQGKIVNDQLQLEWLYSQTLHTREEIAELVSCYGRSLQSLLAYCRTPDAGKYTPADFPRSDLDQDELNALLEQIDF